MTLDQDDSIFEEALRSDLPSADQQDRMRRRLLAAGLSAGSGLAATSAASAVQASWGATVVAKVAALSWPATLALAAVVATPIIALPVWHESPRATRAPVATPASVVVAPRLVASEAAAAAPVASGAASEEPSEVAAEAPRSMTVVMAAHAPEPAKVSTPTPPAVAAFGTPSSAESARASTLAVETQILDRAFAEIGAGHGEAAAALIAEHQQRFPNGLLRQERERALARLQRNAPAD